MASDLRVNEFDDPDVRRAIAMEMRDACIDVGFFYGMSCFTRFVLH